MHGPGAGILESSFSFSLAISLSYAQNCSLPSCCLPRGLLPMQEISERLSAVVIGWWFPPGLAWIICGKQLQSENGGSGLDFIGSLRLIKNVVGASVLGNDMELNVL
ncbi:hypothetical protein MRB53_011522 [Persea americana]|uniref:Uncharacterized protein n=1 Tax=Persea americana TaxID=3435 RepID=A0ACC2LV17_PERAE|nr:hypothetical protein MRB53_011522 [Persea americana]